MAAEPEVLDELHRLRARVPQLTGALAASVDGLVLAHDTPGVEPEGVAALTAAALGWPCGWRTPPGRASSASCWCAASTAMWRRTRRAAPPC